MSDPIIGMQQWFETPPGKYLLDWEREAFAQAVSDMFGYHALQLGLPGLDALLANRMPHKWLALDDPLALPAGRPASVLTDFAALPFPEASIDLVLLPHTLELHPDPHATLREVERVLVPEGRLVICGLNPASLWGLRQARAHLYRRVGFGELFLPATGEFIGYRRLRDWLRLLGFEVDDQRFGCYRPALRTDQWLQRFGWMDSLGPRWWPIFGAVYFVSAVKRVRGARLIEPAWRKSSPLATGSLPVVNRGHHRTSGEPQ